MTPLLSLLLTSQIDGRHQRRQRESPVAAMGGILGIRPGGPGGDGHPDLSNSSRLCGGMTILVKVRKTKGFDVLGKWLVAATRVPVDLKVLTIISIYDIFVGVIGIPIRRIGGVGPPQVCQ